MANVKISQLASAGSLAGTEVLPVVQGGTTKKVTVQAIADLAGGGGGSAFSVTANGTLGSDISISFTPKATIPSNLNGGTSYTTEVAQYASFNYGASGGYGGYGGGGASTTATSIAFDYPYFFDCVFNGSNVITSFSLPTARISTGSMTGLQFSGTSLTTISLPLLTEAYGLNIGGTTSLTTLSCPSLTKFTGYGGLYIGNSSGLTGITSASFPVLAEYNLSIFEPGNITTVNLPSVTTVKQHNYSSYGNQSGASVLASFILPNVVKHDVNMFSLSSHANLTTVTLGTVGTLKSFGNSYSPPYISVGGCALNEASVDGILILIASLDGTNGTTLAQNGQIGLAGGTNASPSQAGLDAKAILLSRGFTISHN